MKIQWLMKNWWFVAFALMLVGCVFILIGTAAIHFDWQYFNVSGQQPWYIIFGKH